MGFYFFQIILALLWMSLLAKASNPGLVARSRIPPGTKRYWYHSSCTQKDAQFQTYLNEMFSVSRKVVRRLSSVSDTDFQRVYETVMHSYKDDAALYGRHANYDSFWGPGQHETMMAQVLGKLSVFQ
jgi:hypothetical protein